MKRLLTLVLCLSLCLLAYTGAFASDSQSIKMYVTTYSAGGATLIPITTIVPGKSRILGWDVGPAVSGSGTIGASIHDVAAAASASSSNQFGELACANTASTEKWFPYPRDVSAGVVVLQGVGSVVTVYYETRIP